MLLMTFSILQITFHIPNVVTLKNKCLSSVVEHFHGFKTKLMSKYVFKAKKIENPCTWIDEETRRQLVEIQTFEG